MQITLAETEDEQDRHLANGTDLITVTVDGDAGEGTALSFLGNWLIEPTEFQVGVALTARGRIAVLLPQLGTTDPTHSWQLLDYDDMNEAMKTVKVCLKAQINTLSGRRGDPVWRNI